MRPRPRRALAFATMAALLLAGCASSPATPQPVELNEGFETDLSAYQKDHELPEDPNNPGSKVAWEIETSQNFTRTGEQSARFFIDGSQDDGTIWLERTLSVEAGTSYEASVEAHAWSQSESFNHIADLVLYLGTSSPDLEDDFPRGTTGQPEENGDGTAAGIREPLNQEEGYHRYAFTWTVPEDNGGAVHVAVGITAVFETEMTYHVDDLTVRLEPTGASSTGAGSPY